MRPLCCLRYFERFGESIFYCPNLPLRRLFGGLAVLGHWVVSKDLALEPPHLHAAGAIRRLRRGRAVVDIGTQGVQGHATLAIPLDPSDFSAAKAAAAIDPDALGTQTH